MKILSYLFTFSFILTACTGPKSTSEADAIFDINIVGEPSNLNPITYTDAYTGDVMNYVMESLLTRNTETYEWQPLLAESWEVSKDGKQFTFKLRKDAKFHNGTPVTAEDVKFSFDVIFDDAFLAARLRPYYSGIEKVEVIDTHTVKAYTKEKYFGNFSSIAVMTIVPKSVYGDKEKGPKLTKVMVGSGPYKLEKYDQGKKIVLKRNPEWWGFKTELYKNYYNFDRIAMRFVKSDELAVQMLEKGDLDYNPLTSESYFERTKSDAWGDTVLKIKFSNDAPKSYGFVAWNLNKEPFNNKNVRVALQHLMNRELMIEKFQYGMSLPATGPWYQQSPYADQNLKPLAFDPQKAKELLAKEGWTDSDKNGVLDNNGKEFKFTLSLSNKEMTKYFTIYKEDLKKQGIIMDINLVEWNSFLKLLDERKFEAATLGWGGGSVDNDPKQIWHSSSAVPGGSNFIDYKNPKVDELIEKARGILDNEKRKPVMREIYRTIAADAPYAFMFNAKFNFYGVNSSVQRPKDTQKYDVGAHTWSFPAAKTQQQVQAKAE